MGGNKRRRRADATARAPTTEAGDGRDGSNDGVLVRLEPRPAGEGEADLPPAWPLDCAQTLEAEAPAAVGSDGSLPSIGDIGLHLVQRTLGRMARRHRKRSSKNAGQDAGAGEHSVTPTAVQRRMWPALLRAFDATAGAGPPINVVGIAPTGSGKTLCYGIPVVAQCVRMLLRSSREATNPSTRVHGVVLVPTRELATQVAKEVKVVAKLANKYLSKCAPDSSSEIEAVAVYGGVDIDAQINAMLGEGELSGQRSLVVAATAGRLLDILKQPASPVAPAFADLQSVVFDEADRMAVNGDMATQVDEILDILKVARIQSGQRVDVASCLVSATLPEKAREMCDKWVPHTRIVVTVGSVTVGEKNPSTEPKKADEGRADGGRGEDESSAVEAPPYLPSDAPKGKHLPQNLDLAQIPAHIVQTLHVCASHKKPKKLILTLQRMYSRKDGEDGRFSANNRLCIAFFAQIKTLKYVSQLLAKEERIPRCVELHGNLNQAERERRLLEFKAGKRPILLATDVAARGLHIPNVHFVVNYDFPGSLDQYVHRCGRAGRKPLALSGTQQPPTVYSFFTREFRQMADSVVELLRTCDAWLDPNLLSLTKEKEASGKGANKSSGRKRKRNKKESADAEKKGAGDDRNAESDDEADPFAFLGKSVLKRASHVSDAEDSEDDGD